MNDSLNKSLYFAWVTAIVATLGSLYFSEIAGFEPCKLCWIQRIFMYPLVLILGIACFRNDRVIAIYVLPLTIIGGCVSILHYSEQKLGLFEGTCTTGVPCSGEYINWLGFITIPLLALVAFVLITVFLWTGLRKR
ncbi:disulfide bond formation protein DsbB [Scopulibacillus darangshiensis]|uniref:Disulfide bond formation protein DsbB n=1 Tax=Scopulibacillus darangshiensis TaxID=442528 RepID=A0A4R2NFC0_9BACL|nr:disulfide oxidoreductase [Scopulibacillus darangshiensis]TCP19983.1 disulfide bond formation protein DsbB [Scopulibacillus darangshiensis]